MREIFKRVKLKGSHVAMLCSLMAIAAAGQMILPALLSQMINYGVEQQAVDTLWTLAGTMAFITALLCLLNFATVRISARISTQFAADLRNELFETVQSFSAAEFDTFGTASLVTRCTSDVINIQNFLSLILRLGLITPLMALMGVAFSMATGGQVSVVLVVSIPVLLIALGAIMMVASKYSILMRKKLDRLNQLFLESLEGTRVIRAFNKERATCDKFEQANSDYARTSITANKIQSFLMPAISAIFGLTTAAVLAMGSVYIESGAMDVGTLVANAEYISLVLASVMMLSVCVMMYPTAHACAQRIEEVLTTKSSITDGTARKEDRPLHSTVEFRNVTFAYPGATEPVIKDISFMSLPGQTTAIIGGTGRGKSSIVKLIPRLYDPLFGEILIDGINAKDYRVDDLRSLIGYVPQKNVLFSGDIAENLNFGNEEGTQQDWISAASIACADEFIAEKDSTYNAAVTQGGTNFSGGQRQRLAIARAVMKQPEIYVFDDSFSALDMKTDQQVRHNLKQHAGDATTIIIAQRISSIIDADQILVVDDSRIIARGTHQELLHTCDMYREIAELQMGKEALGLA